MNNWLNNSTFLAYAITAVASPPDRKWQPWRTVFFTIGGLATIALMLDIIWLMIRGA